MGFACGFNIVIGKRAGRMQKSHGMITLVQEHRFRLVDDDGGHALFILAHGAPLEWQDLERLQQTGTPVLVRHERAPGRIADIAHDVIASCSAGKQSEGERG